MEKVNLRTISKAFIAIENCIKSENKEWEAKHTETLEKEFNKLPSGSGIDTGMTFNSQLSNRNKLVFNFSYHHMDEHGGYDGWTDHKLTITPTFDGFDLKISGKDRNGTKEYLYDLFYEVFEA